MNQAEREAYREKLAEATEKRAEIVAGPDWHPFSFTSVEAAMADLAETPFLAMLQSERDQIRKKGHPVDPIDQYDRRLSFALLNELAHNRTTSLLIKRGLMPPLSPNQTVDVLTPFTPNEVVEHMFGFQSIKEWHHPHWMQADSSDSDTAHFKNIYDLVSNNNRAVFRIKSVAARKFRRQVTSQLFDIFSDMTHFIIFTPKTERKVSRLKEVVLVPLPFTVNEFKDARNALVSRHSLGL